MSTEEVSPTAAKMGRLVLAVLGALSIAAAGAFGYFAPDANVYLVASVLAIGFVLMWLAVAGSDKLCAHLGFWSPWFTP